MILATVGGALGAYFVSRHNFTARSDRVERQQPITDACVAGRYYLEDMADMVGVHDDADVPEFSRWAHVRGRNEGAIVASNGFGDPRAESWSRRPTSATTRSCQAARTRRTTSSATP